MELVTSIWGRIIGSHSGPKQCPSQRISSSPNDNDTRELCRNTVLPSVSIFFSANRQSKRERRRSVYTRTSDAQSGSKSPVHPLWKEIGRFSLNGDPLIRQSQKGIEICWCFETDSQYRDWSPDLKILLSFLPKKRFYWDLANFSTGKTVFG